MKVGDYIHYKFSNYRSYGTGFNSGSSSNINGAFRAQKNAILNSLPKRSIGNKSMIKSTLEQQLNFFFSPNNNAVINTGYTPEETEKIRQLIIQICQSACSALNTNSINWNTLDAFGANEATSQELKDFNKLKRGSGSHLANTNKMAIYRRLKALIDHRDSLGEGISSVDKDFIAGVNKLQNEYNAIIADLEASLTSSDGNIYIRTGYGSGAGMKTGGTFKASGSTSGQSHGDFMKAIQELMHQTKETTNVKLKGLLGEYVPTATQYVFQQVAKKGLQDCLADFNANPEIAIDIVNGKVIGQSRSRKTLDSSKVIGKRGLDSLEATIGDIKTSVSATQDKVDVMLDIPGNQKINASMKNYRLGSGHSSINVLKGTSSLKYLQQYPYFTNHYLNITANIGRDDPAPSSLVQQAHNTAKMTIILHALMGGVWGQQADGSFGNSAKAEIMVVNNSIGNVGNFKVYFMSDIIDAIVKNIELGKVDIKGLNEPWEYNNKWIVKQGTNPRDRVKSNTLAFKRVANILGQLHTQQLAVSIDIQALGII